MSLAGANQGGFFSGRFHFGEASGTDMEKGHGGCTRIFGALFRLFVVCCTRIPRCALFNAFPSALAVSELQLRSLSVVFTRCGHQHVTQTPPPSGMGRILRLFTLAELVRYRTVLAASARLRQRLKQIGRTRQAVRSCPADFSRPGRPGSGGDGPAGVQTGPTGT